MLWVIINNRARMGQQEELVRVATPQSVLQSHTFVKKVTQLAYSVKSLCRSVPQGIGLYALHNALEICNSRQVTLRTTRVFQKQVGTFSGIEEILRLIWKPNVHCLIHKESVIFACPWPDACISCLPVLLVLLPFLHYHPSTPRNSMSSLSFRFSYQTLQAFL